MESLKHPSKRFRNPKRDFKHPKYRNCIELSKYMWELKDANMSPVIQSIVTKVLSKHNQIFVNYVSLKTST